MLVGQVDTSGAAFDDASCILAESSRAPKLARSNLFSKVADWNISQVSGARELLNEFCYWRDGEWKLNCTISGTSWDRRAGD